MVQLFKWNSRTFLVCQFGKNASCLKFQQNCSWKGLWSTSTVYHSAESLSHYAPVTREVQSINWFLEYFRKRYRSIEKLGSNHTFDLLNYCHCAGVTGPLHWGNPMTSCVSGLTLLDSVIMMIFCKKILNTSGFIIMKHFCSKIFIKCVA